MFTFSPRPLSLPPLQGNYSLSGLVGRQMGGKTVGVLGTGAIGAEACRIFKVTNPGLVGQSLIGMHSVYWVTAVAG